MGGGAYVHMYTKYEVSMSNPVPRGGVHRCDNAHTNDDDARRSNWVIISSTCRQEQQPKWASLLPVDRASKSEMLNMKLHKKQSKPI